MFPDASNFIRHFRTARDPNGNVLTEPRHKPRNPLGSVSDMIERKGLSKLLEVGQQATFPLEYRKPVMTSAKLLLQPAANAGVLVSLEVSLQTKSGARVLNSLSSAVFPIPGGPT